MVDEELQPAKSEIEKLLEELLSLENELEPESILLALNPAGFDQEAFNRRLKARLELEAQELRDNGQEVPTQLLRILEIL
jgi:predicted  nucleic acid-binding Zn-ribbon protein